jgi:hypothetical protein
MVVRKLTKVEPHVCSLVHPQLAHNGFPMDGALVGVGTGGKASGTTTIDHRDMIEIMFVCFCFFLLIFLCLLSPIVRLCYVVYRYRERERERERVSRANR